METRTNPQRTVVERIRSARRMPLPKAGHAVITVRMEHQLHQRLKQASHDERLSLNALCVQALEAALEALETANAPAATAAAPETAG